MTPYQPIFATHQALRIAEVRRLLTGAGIAADPTIVLPEELERAVAGRGSCLLIVDGQSMPPDDTLRRLRQSSPGSCIVIWTERLTTVMLLATIECDLHGLLSSRLPPEEAAYALRRICGGERMLRFDSEPLVPPSPRTSTAVAADSSFDAQWMLHGAADSQGRKK
jgi:DNA-binding NarL/FixJ family response regulator